MKKIAILLLVISLSFVTNSPSNLSKSRFFDFDYLVAFKGFEDLAPEAKTIDIWLPLLPETPYQEIEEVTISPEGIATITEDHRYGNKMIHFTFDTPVDPSLQIHVNYKVKRYEFLNKPESMQSMAVTNNGENFKKYLGANRLVTLSSRVKEIAAEVTQGHATTLEKARAIYDYVFDNVSYDKSIEGYGYGDTERVCIVKAGNCTDFHSLFISLARASDIPAKFVIGVPLAEKKQGQLAHYHCWAEFFDEKLGWVPVDISEAWKDKSKREYHFGAVDENRLEFSRGRDIVLEPAQKGVPLNYFVYPYVELDGKEYKGVGVLFKYEDIKDDLSKTGDSSKRIN